MFSWKPIIITFLSVLVSILLALGLSALVAITSELRWDRAFLQLLPANIISMLILATFVSATASYYLGMQAGITMTKEAEKPQPPPSQNLQ